MNKYLQEIYVDKIFKTYLEVTSLDNFLINIACDSYYANGESKNDDSGKGAPAYCRSFIDSLFRKVL